ncbi:hypothetical protein [Serratia plymuthica]|jgi:hypothetical protein|uniref:hypothetical protein n=1 Tax=Serratia plymuthica TaxID=82996 RepID=UPI0002A42A2E|nr:hypothetical protein [Serratia plymuthica]EKF65758.1 hypothetical protein B194_1126 [Serratia plymuthica A30]
MALFCQKLSALSGVESRSSAFAGGDLRFFYANGMILYAFFTGCCVSWHYSYCGTGVNIMMVIARLHSLHHPIDSQPKHVGETVFDSSLHPADVAQLIALHQLAVHKAQPSWRARLHALYRRMRA